MQKWIFVLLTVFTVSIWLAAVWLFLTIDVSPKMVHFHSESVRHLRLDITQEDLDRIAEVRRLQEKVIPEGIPSQDSSGITHQWLGSVTEQKEVSIDFLLESLNIEVD